RALTVAGAVRLEVRPAPKGLQVAQRPVAHEHDVAAAAAVAAIGPAAGHVGPPAEAQGTVAAAAGLDVDSRAIVHSVSRIWPIPCSSSPAPRRASAPPPRAPPPRLAIAWPWLRAQWTAFRGWQLSWAGTSGRSP